MSEYKTHKCYWCGRNIAEKTKNNRKLCSDCKKIFEDDKHINEDFEVLLKCDDCKKPFPAGKLLRGEKNITSWYPIQSFSQERYGTGVFVCLPCLVKRERGVFW